jgi:hypothetical protein
MSTINTTVWNSFSDVQAYEQLEKRRAEIQLDPAFQKWKADLKVSQSYVEPSGFIRAKEINSQYDFSGSTSKSSILNFLKLKGIWS